MNPTPKQMRAIARRPADYARFVCTGQLPRTVTPTSALITLLEKVSPRDRAQIVGLTVGPDLGYSGSRQFHTAEQALRWMKPAQEMLENESWPAESWRNKRFGRTLHIEDVIAAASRCPDGLAEKYPALRAPRPAPASDERTSRERG